MTKVNEGQKFFQPRRYDKTKAQLAFRQQLARLLRARALNESSARLQRHPCKPPATQIKTRRRWASGGCNPAPDGGPPTPAHSSTCASFCESPSTAFRPSP